MRMQPDEPCIKDTHHEASPALAPPRRTLASRTALFQQRQDRIVLTCC